MACFNMLNEPMSFLPFFIGEAIEFVISIKRLQVFLMCDTVNTSIVEQSNHTALSEDSITIREGNFHWGLEAKSMEEGIEIESDSDDEEQDYATKSLQSILALKNVNMKIKKG
jgi:hypothetical protein